MFEWPMAGVTAEGTVINDLLRQQEAALGDSNIGHRTIIPPSIVIFLR
jgi:hypothetical protein